MLELIVVLIILGVLMYLLNTLVPMDARFKTAVNVLVGLCLFLYVLQLFGIFALHTHPVYLR
jgi:hypothetical protein